MALEHAAGRTLRRWLAAVIATALAVGCAPAGRGAENGSTELVSASDGGPAAHVLWVDSYHAGYEWSAEIEEGIRSVLGETNTELTVIRMDTKRITDEQRRTEIGREVAAQIAALAPDVVIASDDNAQKYLVVPHLLETDMPTVFAGVNWSATEYGYPASNVTGMVEVDLLAQLVELLRPYATGERLCILSGDTVTDHKNNAEYNARFFAGSLRATYAADWDEFQEAFVALQQECDVVLIGNNAGIVGWDPAVAEPWIRDNTEVVTGSPQSWVVPYVLIALGYPGQEQGVWAAEAALAIVAGEDPAAIPIAQNQRGDLAVNLAIADVLRVGLQPAVLRSATIYDPVGADNG